jgi:CubicO group peptidase (beta-lactamase class C family)
MRRSLVVLTIAVLLIFHVPLGAADDLLYARFGDYVESLRAQAGIPGLAAVIVGRNDIVWERAFGKRDVERSDFAKTDTPFHVDGVTQVFTAAIMLRCVEEGRLSLDSRVSEFKPSSPDADATIGQLLAHTSGAPENLVFDYRPERLAPLSLAIRRCTGDSYRETLANLLEQLAMIDSVPGPDITRLPPTAEGIPTPAAVQRYARTLGLLATPYAVDAQRRSSATQYSVETLTPASGMISTVRDLAQFDLALRKGVLVRTETLALAWRAPVGRDRQPLPHGLGWFVQGYNGETVVWQFGVGDNSSSSMMVTLPARGLTLIMVANSQGLVRPFPLASGDVTVSPFGKLFLGLFAR